MLYISFNKRRRLASEGLVTLTGMRGSNSDLPAPRTRCYQLLYGPTMQHSDTKIDSHPRPVYCLGDIVQGILSCGILYGGYCPRTHHHPSIEPLIFRYKLQGPNAHCAL